MSKYALLLLYFSVFLVIVFRRVLTWMVQLYCGSSPIFIHDFIWTYNWSPRFHLSCLVILFDFLWLTLQLDSLQTSIVLFSLLVNSSILCQKWTLEDFAVNLDHLLLVLDFLSLLFSLELSDFLNNRQS